MSFNHRKGYNHEGVRNMWLIPAPLGFILRDLQGLLKSAWCPRLIPGTSISCKRPQGSVYLFNQIFHYLA